MLSQVTVTSDSEHLNPSTHLILLLHLAFVPAVERFECRSLQHLLAQVFLHDHLQLVNNLLKDVTKRLFCVTIQICEGFELALLQQGLLVRIEEGVRRHEAVTVHWVGRNGARKCLV